MNYQMLKTLQFASRIASKASGKPENLDLEKLSAKLIGSRHQIRLTFD